MIKYSVSFMKISKIIKSFPLITAPLVSVTCISCSNNKLDDNNDSDNNVIDDSVVIDSKGGNIGTLKVSRYLEIIKPIGLNNLTKLSSLSNEYLTQKLHVNKKFEGLSLKITKGSSEYKGILNLLLVGNYNDKDYNELIEIEGFNSNNENLIFEIDDFSVNLENYFDYKQPIVEKNTLDLTTDTNVIKKIININFVINSQNLTIDQMEENFKLKNINLNLKNNNLSLNFAFETQYKEYNYDNDGWIISSNQNKLIQKNNINVRIPSLKDLMHFMISKFVLKEQLFKDYYASYFNALFKLSVDLDADRTGLLDFIDFEFVIDKYKQTYFNNVNIYPKIDISNTSSLVANDYDHELIFNINLINDENEDDLSISRTFQSNNFKNINLFLNNHKDKTNSIVIKNDEESSISKTIKNLYKNEIELMFADSNQSEINLINNNDKLLTYLSNYWNIVFVNDYENNKKAETNERIKKNYILSIFEESLDNGIEFLQGDVEEIIYPVLDGDTGIFKYSDNEIFQIENISFGFEKNNLNPTLKKINDNTIVLVFNSNIEYLISQKIFSQECRFNLIITRNSISKNF